MRIHALPLFLGMSLLIGSACSPNITAEKEVAQSLKKVKPNDIRSHIAYLADDKLRGRLPGTEGYQMAVDYVVDQYKRLGVEPAGENGTYLQQVRIRKAFPGTDAQMSSPELGGTLALGQEFSVFPNPAQPSLSVEAPLVFAGYGISAPELGYDDYAGLDASGKIVVVLRGAPSSFHSTIASYSADLLTILKNAAAHGAVGVIIGSTSTNPNASVPNLSRGVNSVLGPNGEVAVSRTYVPEVKLLANINNASLQKLLGRADLTTEKVVASLKAGTPVSAPLNATVSASYSTTYQDIESYNVVGKFTGSDAQLRNEYVVHSAHLDHTGVGRPIEGDSIYNGAHDNASGVASVLEIARTYSRLKEKPKRSVVFAMVSAEEMGLLGSAYFASNPTIPKENIVANINTDMPTLIAPLLSVVALGAEHSTLEQQVANASTQLGLTVEADPEPEQNRFVRSDQYSFVTQGIPALHIKYGNKTADGKNNLNEIVAPWRERYYHKPQDQLEGGVFDFEAAKKYVQLNFLISYQIAQDPQRPTWKPGDFFGEQYGSAASRQE